MSRRASQDSDGRGRKKGGKNSENHNAGGAREGAGRPSGLNRAALGTQKIRESFFRSRSTSVVSSAGEEAVIEAERVPAATTPTDFTPEPEPEPTQQSVTPVPEDEEDQLDSPDLSDEDDDEEAEIGDDDVTKGSVWDAYVSEKVKKLQEEFAKRGYIEQIKCDGRLWILPKEPGIY